MKKTTKSLFAIIMVIALAVSGLVATPGVSQAAKKPALNKKKVSIKVGGTYKLKIKKASKKAKVTWKSSKKAVVKVAKKKTKGKKANKITGLSVGSAKITAIYKAGGLKKKLKCKVTVTAADNGANQGGNSVQPTTPAQTGTATNAPATQGPSASDKPVAATEEPAKETATPRVTRTPRPTTVPSTPTPVPTPTPTPKYPTPTNDPYPGYFYSVDLTDKSIVNGPGAVADSNGYLVITSTGAGHDTKIDLPESELSKFYTKVTIEYELESGTFAYKYHKFETSQANQQDDYEWGEQYQFKSGQTTASTTFKKDYFPIDQLVIFDWYSAGKITIKSIILSDPLVAVGTPNPTNAPDDPSATTAPTTAPTTSPTENPYIPLDGTYVVNLSDSSIVSGQDASINSDGNLVLTSTGGGHDTKVILPEEEVLKEYHTLTIEYEVVSGTFAYKYHKYGTPNANAQDDYEWGDQYRFNASQTVATTTFKDAMLPVDEVVLFDWFSAGTLIVKSIVFSDPAAPSTTPTPPPSVATPTPTPAAATPTPTPEVTPTAAPDFELVDSFKAGETYMLLFNNTPVDQDTNLYYENIGTLHALTDTNAANSLTFTDEISEDRTYVNVKPADVKTALWKCEAYNGSDSQFTFRNLSSEKYLADADGSAITFADAVSANTAWTFNARTGENYPYNALMPVSSPESILRISNGSAVFKFGNTSRPTDGRNANVYIYKYVGSGLMDSNVDPDDEGWVPGWY